MSVAYLLSDSARLLRRRFDAKVRVHGVTGPQARLLLLLSLEGQRSQGHFAELLDVEPITLCRMADRLEEAGLIERRADPADRRVRQLALTGMGEERIAHLRTSVDELVDEMLQGMAESEAKLLTSLLGTIRSNLGGIDVDKQVAHG